jgi:sec-independent protein translocase protein TatB
MFDFSGGELAIIAIVALVAIGPKELPGVLRMVGQWVGKARKMAREFQDQFNEAIREADVAEMKKQFEEAADKASHIASTSVLGSSTQEFKDAFKLDSPTASAPTDIRPEGAASTETAPTAEVSSSEAAPAETKPADTVEPAKLDETAPLKQADPAPTGTSS